MRSGPNGNECVDSVIIDYDDDHGNEFSRRFDLKRNQDNSIAWVPASEITLRGQATLPEPEPRNLADLRHDLYLASKFEDEHSAAVQFSKQLEEERVRVREMTGELNRLRFSPRIEISPSSPQGGMALSNAALTPPLKADDWIHFALSVKNSDASMSLCDLILTLDFEEENGDKTVRHVERAVFRTSDMTFPNKLCCLEAGHSAECVMAIWSNSVGVQTIRSWANGTPSMPLGDALYPGVWWCNATAKAQGVEQRARYRFKMLNNSVSRFMLPPGTSGETG